MAGEHLTLVVAPELGFDQLESRLSARGYALGDHSAEPLVQGEPEWAVFENGCDCRIHYTFNPVATFRLLQFSGAGAVAAFVSVALVVPEVDWTRARSFLRSPNPRDQWLGILAAEQLRDVRLKTPIETLATRGQPQLAAAARAVLSSLPDPARADEVLDGWQAIVDKQRRSPGDNLLFRHLADRELKRQVLRWTGREGAHGGAGAERLLRTALADDDPEVRVTAILVAARIGRRDLVPEIRAAALPESRSDGAPPGDRLYYRTLQRAAVRYLAQSGAVSLKKADDRRRETFYAALRGEQPAVSDETLLWHALVTPLDLGDPPQQLPPGVAETETGYSLAVPDGSIELCWVGRIPHLLGGLGTPVRRRAPTAPFFISTKPLTTDTGQGRRRWSGAFEAALRLVDELANATRLRLPTADEWEMAARGPDGRFYPWGVGLQSDWRSATSPWGMAAFGQGEEWAAGEAASTPVVVNAAHPAPASNRGAASRTTSAQVRLVVPT